MIFNHVSINFLYSESISSLLESAFLNLSSIFGGTGFWLSIWSGLIHISVVSKKSLSKVHIFFCFCYKN